MLPSLDAADLISQLRETQAGAVTSMQVVLVAGSVHENLSNRSP